MTRHPQTSRPTRSAPIGLDASRCASAMPVTRYTLSKGAGFVRGRVMRPGDLAPTVFTTVGLRDARRVELWEEHNATALIGLEVRAPEPLQATELITATPPPRRRFACATPDSRAATRPP